MDINDENLSDFPEINHGADKLLFLRLGSGVNFLQVFKSISLNSTNMIYNDISIGITAKKGNVNFAILKANSDTEWRNIWSDAMKMPSFTNVNCVNTRIPINKNKKRLYKI